MSDFARATGHAACGIAVATRDLLGESPVWCPVSGTLRWIDAMAPVLHAYDPVTGGHRTIPLPFAAPAGMIARTPDPYVLIVSHPGGLTRFGLSGRVGATLVHPEASRDGVAYNDGKTDRDGRLWFGSADPSGTEPRGIAWRLGRDGSVAAADAGFAVFNGPAFSPGGSVAYVSDSMAARILAYDVRLTPPFLTHRRVFATMIAEEGLPDGLTVDAAGDLWCAMWGGARVVRFDAAGGRRGLIAVPARQVTSVAFGGAALDTLYITTARCDLDDEELARTPNAGALFRAHPGVVGLPEAAVRWDGTDADAGPLVAGPLVAGPATA